MDLWRIRTEEPLFLPWGLDWIGGFRFTLFNGWLSDDNPSPADPRYGSGVDAVKDPGLLGMRFSYHPTSWFDLGFSRTILFGGRGREVYDTPKDWWELFTARNENTLPGESTRYDNDQYASFDVTARLPVLNGLGLLKSGKIYWEHGGTDLNAPWKHNEGWSPLIIDLLRLSDLAGLYLSTGVTDLRVEYALTHKAWYHNKNYSQGYTYQGHPLGHHMGGDAQDWYVEVSRYFGPAWRASVGLDVEDRGRSLPETEKRREISLEVTSKDLTLLGVPLEARLNGLAADINAPLDDPARNDRTEWLIGIGVTARLFP
jgi:hypothetical protein